MTFTYGSICSGVDAASLAWGPLQARPLWFAEIEPFPAAVLAHRWPRVVNVGDMCQLRHLMAVGVLPVPDVLVGGTPCQSFSVAGLRQSLDDGRGQLTLEYVRLLDEIDKHRPGIAVWENVPGVLGTPDNAFGCFLGALAGEDAPLVPAGKRWSNAGYVSGPTRTIAWRILDAQYFGVAQRRRRVFVIASARDDCDPREVLFESEGLRRDTAPSRETQATTAGAAADGVGECSQVVGNPLPFGAVRALLASHTATGRLDPNEQTFVVHGTQDPGVTAELAYALGRNSGQENAIVFSSKDHGADASIELAPTLRAGGHTGSHANAGVPPAVAFAQNTRGELRLEGGDGQRTGSITSGGGKPGQGYPAVLTPWDHQHARIADPQSAAPSLRGGSTGTGDTSPRVFDTDRAVRRLTPVECERLQGMPDNHTQIPWRGKPAEECPDGPRYKAIGNSMAVPVMAWIGRRLPVSYL